MGFYKDVHQLKKIGRAASNNWDAQGQIADAQMRLAASAQMMAQQNEALRITADGIPASALIIDARQSTVQINSQAQVTFDLLVTPRGGAPYPVTISETVSQMHLSRIQPGAMLAVAIARTDPTKLAIDWFRPV
jgi:hypothetical protein